MGRRDPQGRRQGRLEKGSGPFFEKRVLTPFLLQVVVLQRAAHEVARRVAVERRALGEALGVVEERDEELPLVDRGADAEAAAALLELAPGGAHLGPEGLGALVVGLAGREVVVAD